LSVDSPPISVPSASKTIMAAGGNLIPRAGRSLPSRRALHEFGAHEAKLLIEAVRVACP